ncbi:flagellar biosynthesis regulator FlaF [Aliishimia ponticola]|nr:flagellar biosynthesis regulator FlaF [Aliishimia ponticola]
MAHRAYASTAETVRTPRSVEFQVIARITHRLKSAIQSKDRRKLIEAMHENRLLWNTLAADVASPQNGLPDDLKARIFYLAEFTVQHTRKVLKNEDNAVALLEINAAILGGLQHEGKVT